MAHEVGQKMVISRNSGPSKVKEETKPQWPVPTETSPISPAASFSSTTPVNRADVERKAQSLCVQLLGSDHYWNCLALSAAKWWELSPLREAIKELVHKYRDNPAAFVLKLTTLRKDHHRRLARDPSQKENIAWYNELQRRVNESCAAMLPSPTENLRPERMDGLPTLPNDLPPWKLQAINFLLDMYEAIVTGRPPSEMDPKKLIEAFATIVARSAGRPGKYLNREAYKLVLSRKYENAVSPYHCICEEIDPKYPGMSDNEKVKARRARREGVRRLQAAAAKKKRAKAR
jgi:hypothetical protein